MLYKTFCDLVPTTSLVLSPSILLTLIPFQSHDCCLFLWPSRNAPNLKIYTNCTPCLRYSPFMEPHDRLSHLLQVLLKHPLIREGFPTQLKIATTFPIPEPSSLSFQLFPIVHIIVWDIVLFVCWCSQFCPQNVDSMWTEKLLSAFFLTAIWLVLRTVSAT